MCEAVPSIMAQSWLWGSQVADKKKYGKARRVGPDLLRQVQKSVQIR